MNKIGIVRHGRTAWNLERRAQGSSDIPLDKEGVAGAQKIAERLKDEEWHIVYSSDLSRAKQTAEAIVAESALDLKVDPRIREVGGGLTEGTTEEERVAKWGPNWRALDMEMENQASVKARGIEFIEEKAKSHEGENVLIVSHGNFIRHLLRALLPELPEGQLENTSFTVLTKTDTGWECELYNCTKHLEGSFS